MQQVHKAIETLRQQADYLQTIVDGPTAQRQPGDIGIREAAQRLGLLSLENFEIETSLHCWHGKYRLDFRVWDGKKFHEGDSLIGCIEKAELHHKAKPAAVEGEAAVEEADTLLHNMAAVPL